MAVLIILWTLFVPYSLRQIW